MQLLWLLFEPKLEKIKKIPPPSPSKKKINISRNFCPKKLNKTFKNFLASKNVIQIFYILNKTPLGDTGYLKQPLLFTGCSRIQFFNSPPFLKHGQLGHTWYPTPHAAAIV